MDSAHTHGRFVCVLFVCLFASASTAAPLRLALFDMFSHLKQQLPPDTGKSHPLVVFKAFSPSAPEELRTGSTQAAEKGCPSHLLSNGGKCLVLRDLATPHCGVVLSRLVSNTRLGWANVPRWGGGGGSAAGSLLATHQPQYTWACVLCRPSPELPFHFVWFLGWSTRHLALDPSSVMYLQHKLCPYLDALQRLPPPQPVPRQLLPLRHIQLTQPRFYTSRFLAFHCFLCFFSASKWSSKTPKTLFGKKVHVKNRKCFTKDPVALALCCHSCWTQMSTGRV
jgi:hypothetical protein